MFAMLTVKHSNAVSNLYHKISLSTIYEACCQRLECPVKSDHSSPFRRWAPGGGAAADRALTHRSYRRPQSLATSSSERDMYTKVEDEAKKSEDVGILGSNGVETSSVSAWSLGLERLLADPRGTHAFCAFLAREFAAENIRFWTACERYARSGGGREAAEEIWKRHLSDGAQDPVNVDASARNAAKERLEQAPPDLFIQAQKQIYNLMKFDSYPRFLRSGVHAECGRAELRGISPPYPGSSELQVEPHQISAPTQLSPSPTKLKKSLSNAEERRRGSLLPWARAKIRVASRDRTENSSSIVTNFTNNQPCPNIEIRKCDALCRIMLPDSATTVVAVDDTQTIRQLIDRLLEKRAIVCRAFDVFYVGSNKALDANALASTLGGRVAVVERRVVFRMELPNRRCVSVRCRPSKPLRDVLRPVLQRYGRAHDANAATAGATAVLVVALAGTRVDLDSPVQVADGQRLQVCLNEEILQSHHSQCSKMNKTKQLTQNEAIHGNINQVNGVPTLDEITNRVFEELLQGKTENQVSRSDRGSIKSDNCESEVSSNIFSQAVKREDLGRQTDAAADGSPGCCEGSTGIVRKPLIAKLRAGVKVQSANNDPENSQTRLKEKFLNGDFNDGNIAVPLQTSCSYESALKCTAPPIPAARNPSNILAKPCPAVRTTISQARSSLPHSSSTQTYSNELFKLTNISDEDDTSNKSGGHKSFFNGSYSLPKSGFNSLENTVIENNTTLCVDHLENGPALGLHSKSAPHQSQDRSEINDFNAEADRKHPRMGDPPPLPPKPKVLPAKPSNWGQTLSEHSLIDVKMQEVNLPSAQTADKKLPYLDRTTGSFV